MKVGDRIRVFEILDGMPYDANIIGVQRPEMRGKYFGNKYGVVLDIKDITGFNFHLHFNIDNEIVKRRHVRHVATMVVTKIKNQ